MTDSLSRYILKNFFITFVFCLIIVFSMFILGDVLNNMDNFIKDSQRSGKSAFLIICTHYLVVIPRYYYHLGPLIILMAALFTIVLMKRAGELKLLMASGIPLHRVCLPVFLGTALLSLTVGLNLEFFMPNWPFQLPSKSFQRHISPGPVKDRGGNVIHPLRYFPEAQTMRGSKKGKPGLVITERYSGGELKAHISAPKAHWSSSQKGWILEDGWKISFDRKGKLQPEKTGPFARYHLITDIHPIDLESMARDDEDYLGILPLLDQYHRRGLGQFKLKIHIRLAYFFQAFLLVFLCLPLFLQRQSLHPALGMMVSLALAATFLLLVTIFQSLGQSEVLPPIMAVWIPYGAAALVGIELYSNIRS